MKILGCWKIVLKLTHRKAKSKHHWSPRLCWRIIWYWQLFLYFKTAFRLKPKIYNQVNECFFITLPRCVSIDCIRLLYIYCSVYPNIRRNIRHHNKNEELERKGATITPLSLADVRRRYRPAHWPSALRSQSPTNQRASFAPAPLADAPAALGPEPRGSPAALGPTICWCVTPYVRITGIANGLKVMCDADFGIAEINASRRN